MTFTELSLPGVWLIGLEKHEDERGFFARTWCEREFADRGLNPRLVQCNISHNRSRGTLRGMHWQRAPHEEAKLIRCTHGAIYDVIAGVCPDSPAFQRWIAVELRAPGHELLYIPGGFAHGFQTLEDDTEVFYQMSERYHPESAAGFRWNDPAFAIEWPQPNNPIVSGRDASYPDFTA